MSGKIWQTARCQSCRYDVLETFASLAGVTLRPTFRPGNVLKSSILHQKPRPTPSQCQRYFSAQTRTRSDLQKDDTPSTPPPETTSQAEPPSIPWYLQVASPTPPSTTLTSSNPLLSRQTLPTLPPSAPPILSPILTYLSSTAGLENLLLLDLRHLDPPAALGSNLIMLIGTARSVKHLNVSADRFCRWCRSTYKLRPYADGLLGRNELKLKLRRKARRQKLAQSVGSTVDQRNGDDGITTGWVCVNVGPVDEAVVAEEGEAVALKDDVENIDPEEEQEQEEEEYVNPDSGYIGFGSSSTAPRIVVQMFTEEKRLEMDLEGLWEVRTSRRANKEEKAEAEVERTHPTRDVWGELNSDSARDGLDQRDPPPAAASS